MIRFHTQLYVVLTVFFLFIQKSNAQEFTKQTTENGLSIDTVDFITEDEDGYVYIGTPLGLNVFNGTSYKTYNTSNTSDFSNQVKCILPIDNELIIIGTLDKGLYLFNKKYGSIIPIKIKDNNRDILVLVYAMHQDKDNTIWIGTKKHGLLKISPKQLQIEESQSFVTLESKKIRLNFDKHVNVISSTRDTLYIGTLKNGLYALDIQSQQGDFIHITTAFKEIWDIKRYKNKLFIAQDGGLEIINFTTQKHQLLLQHSLLNKGSKNTITSISIDEFNRIWVSTLNDGLYSISTKTNTILHHFVNNPTDSRTLNINKIITTFIDNQQQLWVGTWHGGINILPLKPLSIKNYLYEGKSDDLSQNITWDILTISKNNFLIGSNGNGINLLSPDKEYFEESTILKNVKYAKSFVIDRQKQDLWVATWENGLIKYNLNSKKSVSYLTDEGLPLRILKLILDTNGILWIGTNLNGLYSLDTNNLSATPQRHFVYPNYNASINSGYIHISSILSAPNNILWVGSNDYGLLKIKKDSKGHIINSMPIEVANEFKKPYRKVRNLYQDDENNIWIGYENGAVKFNTVSNKLTAYPFFDDMVVSGFLKDSNNNIWVITYDGLYKYNLTNKKTTHYFSGTVFQSIIKNELTDNKILLSSNHGVIAFDPDYIDTEKQLPMIMISSYINNQNTEQTPTSNKLIRLNYIERLTLNHQNNTLNLKASTLYFGEHRDSEILYKLENYETNWNRRDGSETIITYNNIPHGNYKLLIKSSMQNDSENAQIKILELTILPPLWLTWYAKVFYFIFVVSLLGFIKLIVSRRHLEKINKIEVDKEKDLQNSKLAFFTNISHDIRTPLTLILGPIENLLSKDLNDSWEHKQHSIIHKNTNLLLNLINQILDFRKLDTGKMKLKTSRTDIVTLIKSCINQFEYALKEKKIDINLIEISNPNKLWVDANKMEKVFINLFSNAIKYSDYKKDIKVKITSSEKYISIKITNYGLGIPQNELPNIFERFYQLKYNKGGSGIGLSIVKSMIELHYGKIKVNSKPNKETCFTIKLPLGKSHLKPYEMVVSESDTRIKKITPKKLTQYTENNVDKKVKETLLIIEDNDEIRSYLKDILKDEFNVVDVNNGEWGVEKAEALIPSLILSDIMMNGIDGVEVCRILKNNINTSHIPIILLTAKNTDDDKIDGYNEGADDYITKPFNTQLLKTRIRNLLEQRKILREKSKLPNIEPSIISPTTVDESFMVKTMKILDENMSNNLLSIEELAEMLNMSQSQFYRKIKNLTGFSANKFLQVVRLKRAAQLLSTNKYKISEVLYEVGFTSPSYFTKCFKKQFGKSPSEFLENKNK